MKRQIIRAVVLLLIFGTILIPAVQRAAETSSKIALPAYQKIKLENGMTILLMERHQLPLISYRWILRSGGSICDPEGREGLASLTAELLRKGTTTRSADQISEALDFVGASFDSYASKDYSGGSAGFLKKDLPLSLDLISDLLMHPTFPQAEVEKTVKQEIDGIKEDKGIPQRVIQIYFERFLYGSQLYGRPVGGNESTLAKISRDDIVRFYGTHYVPNELILAVAGDFNTADLEKGLREKFSSWEPKSVTVPEVKDAAPVEGKHILLVDKPDSTQTFFRIGNVGVRRTNPDWIPLEVINTLFGGRFTSMINSALRIKSGLTYGANSFFTERKSRGAFAIASFTPTASTERALNITLDVMKTFQEKGITAGQLKSAKIYIKGQFGPTLETSGRLADRIASLEFYGLDARYIDQYFAKVDALTLPEAKRIIQTYYPQDNWDLVLIGKNAAIAPMARKLASDVHQRSITEIGF